MKLSNQTVLKYFSLDILVNDNKMVIKVEICIKFLEQKYFFFIKFMID